jgi:hypothetical protein
VFAIVACLIAAAASLMRGGHYHASDEPAPQAAPPRQHPTPRPEEHYAS